MAAVGRPVRQLTIDHLVRTRNLSYVDSLIIDTEGHDPLVLRGADRTLRQHKVGTLEFEYHYTGLWISHALRATLDWLAERGTNSHDLRAFGNCLHEFLLLRAA